jgi:nitrite reductase/ring-hydroxylating ferredoxin subunit
LKEKKVVIANIEDKFCSFNDRCPHSNAPLHLGTLYGKVITCALHFSSFDVTTGKKLSGPKDLSAPAEIIEKMVEIIEKMPANFLQMEEKLAEIRRQIETLDLEKYKTKNENNRIFMKI